LRRYHSNRGLPNNEKYTNSTQDNFIPQHSIYGIPRQEHLDVSLHGTGQLQDYLGESMACPMGDSMACPRARRKLAVEQRKKTSVTGNLINAYKYVDA